MLNTKTIHLLNKTQPTKGLQFTYQRETITKTLIMTYTTKSWSCTSLDVLLIVSTYKTWLPYSAHDLLPRPKLQILNPFCQLVLHQSLMHLATIYHLTDSTQTLNRELHATGLLHHNTGQPHQAQRRAAPSASNSSLEKKPLAGSFCTSTAYSTCASPVLPHRGNIPISIRYLYNTYAVVLSPLVAPTA